MTYIDIIYIVAFTLWGAFFYFLGLTWKRSDNAEVIQQYEADLLRKKDTIKTLKRELNKYYKKFIMQQNKKTFIKTKMVIKKKTTRTINELLVLGKEEFNNPKYWGFYIGICNIYHALQEYHRITHDEYSLIKDYLEKNLPQRRYNINGRIGHVWSWHPRNRRGRNKWLSKHIKLTNTCEFGEHMPIASAGMVVCSRCGKTLVDY